jgi:hypothetical protein
MWITQWRKPSVSMISPVAVAAFVFEIGTIAVTVFDLGEHLLTFL